MYKVIGTQPFLEEYKYFFDKNELIKFEKFKKRLKSNPYLGDMLRVNFVREFKTKKGKRAYFIIFVEYRLVLFVGYSKKKNQKNIIDEIFLELDKFREIAKQYQNS